MRQNPVQFRHGMSVGPCIERFGSEEQIYVVSENQKRITALSLERHPGVSYRSGCRTKQMRLGAILERGDSRRLAVVVLADGALLGGRRSDKVGRSSENKAPFH